MGLSAERLAEGIAHLIATEPRFAEHHARLGPPQPRIRPRGFDALMRAIVGQQVSVAAADSIWRKLEAATGADPARVLAADDATLRATGLSGQKVLYARNLAAAVLSGALNLDALPENDEEAIAQITAIKGLGRWTAEIYLLFAEGRPDVFPAGDLAVQLQLGRVLGLESRPTEKQTRALALPYSPHRGATAIFLWHIYNAPPL
jgi:DNA-3-methyladenine glycosylase II